MGVKKQKRLQMKNEHLHCCNLRVVLHFEFFALLLLKKTSALRERGFSWTLFLFAKTPYFNPSYCRPPQRKFLKQPVSFLRKMFNVFTLKFCYLVQIMHIPGL